MSLVETLSTIQQYISWCGWPTWLICGSIGCLFNILLFSHRQFRTTSCCLYFLVSSVTMLVVLNIGIIPTIYAFNHPNPFHTISGVCKTRAYIGQCCLMIYRWLMAIASIDRYIHTFAKPHLLRFTHTRVANRIIFAVVIIWLILPFHQLVWIDVLGNVCTYRITIIRVYNSFYTMILGGLFPSLIMLIFTLLIRYNLKVKRNRLFHLASHLQQHHPQHLLRSRDQQALAMLFIQIFVYMITNFPWILFTVYTALTTYMIKSAEHLAIENFLRFLTEFIMYIYPALSFPMYTLASRTFREQLMKILKSICLCRHQRLLVTSRIQPTIYIFTMCL